MIFQTIFAFLLVKQFTKAPGRMLVKNLTIKNVKNPLTNRAKHAIIKTQQRKGKKKMQKFNFNVNYVEINKNTVEIDSIREIAFSTVADTHEEGRAKALEFAQSIARCYNDNDEAAFFFRITVD